MIGNAVGLWTAMSPAQNFEDYPAVCDTILHHTTARYIAPSAHARMLHVLFALLVQSDHLILL